MKGLAELILSLVDLAEAEGRLFRANIVRVGRGCGLIAIGLLFVAAALAFCVAALYSALIEYIPRPYALLLLGGICAIFAAVLLWIGNPPRKK